MNQQQNTIKLLNQTFNNNFDVVRYIKFIKELFNEIKINQRDCTKYIANEYKEYISSFIKIADYKDSDSKEMEVLIVKLNRTSSKDRARVMQRNFVANWLGKTGKDVALVVFYDDTDDWRFSFVKMEYSLIKDESGKVRPVKELTPAKRYSFLVGVNEPNHTCRKQFLKLVMEEEVNPLSKEIEQAFSIDKVTKEFFEKYKELYLDLKEELEKLVKRDEHVKKEFEEKGISIIDFARKLLGQIVFIYFLQKKGWLGVDVNGKWGDGPKDFMRCLFGDKKKGTEPLVPYKNFFNEILEPLFYDALATDRSADDHYYPLFKCKIPFLNGGLFEPINEYNWSGVDIVLDNSIFDRILSTFDRFNFTVKEDEPLEKEVAVDPEMLGKIFENLLGVKDRKSKGAYYTPREIVHYMCQQSLINFFETNTDISRKDIENFVQMGDVVLDQSIRAQEQKKRRGWTDVNQEKIIPKSIGKNHEKINELLKKIKIVDPACGSGAFLIGMLNEIIKARSILGIYSDKEIGVYDVKREIIENCLYGVDIEPSAVQICKLRFWLSLIVDESDIKNIKPLPNLDHKIMCGNSLLEEFEGVKLFDEKLLGEVKKDYSFEIKQIEKEIDKLYKEKGDIARGKTNSKTLKKIDKEIKDLKRKKQDILSGPKEAIRNLTLDEAIQRRIKESKKKLAELKKLQKKFFDEQNRKLKKQLRADIDKIEWELIEETLKEQGNLEAMQKLEQYKKNKAKPFFLWKLYFAEVFQRENSGFDVVITNPPYVSSWNAEKAYKDYFVKNYKSTTGHYDLYVLFLEKSTQILREKGTSSFITSNKFFSQKYGLGIRSILLENKICEIINFNCNVFETSTVETAIIIFKKEQASLRHHIKILNINKVKDYNFSKKQLIHQEFFNELPNKSFRLNLNDEKFHIIKKIEIGTTHLENLCYIDCGIVPHSSKFNLKKKYFIHDSDNKSKYKKYLEGKDISRNYIPRKTRFFDYQPSKHHRPKFKELFENKKILIKDIGGKSKIVSVVDESYHYTNDTIRICVLLWDLNGVNNSQFRTYTRGKNISLSKKYNIKFLQAVISSKLMSFYFFELICGGLHIYPNEIRLFPIKQCSGDQQKPFTQLVDQILSITKSDNYSDNPEKQAKVKKLENEIDQLVYKLYELTPEEIKIVEEFNK